MRAHCGSFSAGHDVHYIQVLRVAPMHPALDVEEIDAPGGDIVRLLIDGVHHRLHNHAPKEILDEWETRTGIATWTPRAALLKIPHPGGSACFSVSATSPGPCAEARVEQERMNAMIQAAFDEAIADGALEEGWGDGASAGAPVR